MGLINAFGMFWRRDEVNWRPPTVQLLGAQLAGSRTVDFAQEPGVYILYGGNKVIYVRRVTDPDITRDQKQAVIDELAASIGR